MRKLKLFFACMLLTLLSVGQMWATDEVVYTLTPVAGNDNGYATNEDIDITDGETTITWNVTGNATMTPWRIGGKNLSGVNREVYSKDAMSAAITKVELTVGTASSVTVNSLKLIVASDEDFSDVIDEVTENFTASSTITFEPTSPATKWATGAYYKFVFTVTIGNSNKYVQFTEAKFYAEAAAPAFTITALSNDESKGTVSLTGSVITGSPEDGFRYASPAYSVSPANSATVSQNGNAFTVTPSANTTVTINFEEIPQYTVTWNNNGDENTTTQVYEGEKPVFPATPAACDATSTTFIGWATAPWDGKIANLSEKTIYTSAAAMPDVDAAVTYYAVFAKSSGSAGNLFEWEGGTSSALTALENVTASGLGTDYAEGNAPYRVKFDTEGDYIVITTSGAIESVAVGVKMLGGGNTSHIYVQEAEDAESDFSAVETLTISGAQNDVLNLETENAFKADSRAVKLLFNKGANVGVGPITIVGATSYEDYMTTCCTKYAVNIAEGITNGSVTADPTSACEGATVTLTFTPALNYHLSGWTLNSAAQDVADNTFTMPGEAVTVSATFAQDACDPLGTPNVNVSGKAYPYDAVKLSWTAISNADAYKVYIYDNEDNELEHNDAFTGVEYTIGQTLGGSTTYKYSVQAVSNTPATYCPSEAAAASFNTEALPTAVLTLMNLGEAHAQSGVAHAITVPFNLPTTAAACSKAFVGWDTDPDCATAPTYAKGAEFTFANTTGVTLYAVYADAEAGDVSYTKLTSDAFDVDATYIIAAAQTTSDATMWYLNSCANTDQNNGYGFMTTDPENNAPIQFQLSGTASALKIREVSGAKRYLKGLTTGNFQMSASEQTLTLSNAGAIGSSSNYILRHNYNSGNGGLRWYSSNTGTIAYLYKVEQEFTYSNYATTCVEAPEAIVDPEEVNAPAAGVANGVIEAAYENVNEAEVAVALYNNAICTEAFEGSWLTASIDGDKNIAYTIAENTSYNDARTAYIKLTAPETTGATAPAVVIIPVSQAKKAAVFSTLEELVAADVNANTNVTVSFSNAVIKEIYYYNSNRRGLVFDIQKADEDIKIYFNADVPAEWVAGGKVSGTLTNCPWKIYSDAWQLAPANGWQWAWDEELQKGLVYSAPAEVSTVVVSGSTTKKTYVDGEKLNPAGLSVRVTYTDDTYEDNPVGVTFSEVVLHDGDETAQITATFGTTTSNAYTVTGLTVGAIQLMSIEDFIAAGGARCYLEGIVSNYTNKTKGYFDLTDASGTIYIYGCDEPSEFAEDDKIRVLAEEYLYYQSTTHEAKNVVFVSKTSPVEITITSASTVELGNNLNLTATTEPAAGAEHITYSIKSGSESKVSLSGAVLTGLELGEATIIASVPDGEGYIANSVEFTVEVIAAVVHASITYEENGGDEVADVDDATNLPDPLPTTTKEGYTFAGWFTTSTFEENTEAVAGTVLTGDIILYAKWTEVPYWATVFTSNISVGADAVVISGENYSAKKAGAGSAYGSTTVTVPAGSTKLHFHAAGWGTDNVVTLAVKKGETSLGSFVLNNDAGVKASSPYTLEGNPYEQYYSVDLSGITENTAISFTATGGYRFVLYGVNAIYPEITLSPSSYNFGEVFANATAEKEFEISTNTAVTGALVASIIDDENGKFSVGQIVDNKVKVTFNPANDVNTFTAKLKVEASNASVTANLTAEAIDASTPVIEVNTHSLNFGRVNPNDEVASKSVNVTLTNLVAANVNAEITGEVFTLTNNLAENGTLVIIPNTETKGIYSEIIRLSATDATTQEIAVTMTVASKWDMKYTSNVTLTTEGGTSATASKVVIGGTQYNAIKAGTGSVYGVVKVTVPAKTQELHIHAAAWKGETVTLNISGATPSSLALTADDGMSNNSPYTLQNSPISQAFDLAIPYSETETIITFTADNSTNQSGKRFVIYGVNQVGGEIIISDDTDASDIAEDINLVVTDDVTLNMNEDKSLGQVIVSGGNTLTISGTGALTAEEMIVEGEDKIVLNTTVETPVFRISTAIGQNTSSGQVVAGANLLNAQAVYLDVQLVTDDEREVMVNTNGQQFSRYWYTISAPFDVNISDGFYTTDDMHLVNNQHIQVWSFAPDQYAEGGRGWKRCQDVMLANQAHLIGFAPSAFGGEANVPNVIRLKAAAIDFSTPITSFGLTPNSGAARDYNWNGLANPSLYHINVNVTITVYDNYSHSYSTGISTFVVGSPLFCEWETTVQSILLTNANSSVGSAPARESETNYKFNLQILKQGARYYDNQMVISASESALPTYEGGKDLETLNDNCNGSAILWTNAYGKRLAAQDAPLQNNQAIYDLSIMTPAAGTYVLRQANEVEGATLYVTYNGAIVWNLSLGDYELDLTRGTTTGYGLLLVAQPNQMPTGLDTTEGVSGDAVQKILLNGQLYILRDGHLFDAVGHEMK